MVGRRVVGRAGLGAAAAMLAGGAEAAGVTPAAKPDPAIVKLPAWSRVLGEGVDAHPYGMPSKFEKEVVRRDVSWLTANAASSINFTPLHDLEGIITPNGLCFERHHGGVAEIDPAEHRLMIHGLVERPVVLTLADIKRLPRTNRIYFLECAANSGMEWRGAQLNGCQFTHGMIHNVMYTGVTLRTLLDGVGVRPGASWMMAEGADAAGLNRSIPLAKALDDCMIAFAMNGEALRPEQGYPLRLVVPGWQGNMWVKWLRRLKFDNEPWITPRGNLEIHRPDAGRPRPALHLGDGREIGDHQPEPAEAGARPRADRHQRHRLVRPRQREARGRVDRRRPQLARGAARRSGAAAVAGAVLCRHGLGRAEMILQSRAYDSTGYIQPTKDELRKIRGVNSTYHNNGIQTWLVRANGECENVEVS